MVALGEISAYIPHKKGFSGYGTRFVDPAFGFALGWNYLMKCVKTIYTLTDRLIESVQVSGYYTDEHQRCWRCHSVLEPEYQCSGLDGSVMMRNISTTAGY